MMIFCNISLLYNRNVMFNAVMNVVPSVHITYTELQTHFQAKSSLWVMKTTFDAGNLHWVSTFSPRSFYIPTPGHEDPNG
jgi:hypothetical protein